LGVDKRTYRDACEPATKPKLEGKLLRVFYSWHITSYAGTIFNIWRATEIVTPTIKDQPFDLAVSLAQRKIILCETCRGDDTVYATLSSKFERRTKANGRAGRVVGSLRR
jgi:hypothetical protein